ncbi:hypothetical protein HZ326_16381 [Fusarium oxysporum f. sp. albedinis]|nr:hypothetical protein HZ326_16381 [Fusarium oxysporum f. sp. albedinis]
MRSFMIGRDWHELHMVVPWSHMDMKSLEGLVVERTRSDRCRLTHTRHNTIQTSTRRMSPEGEVHGMCWKLWGGRQ